MLTLEEVPAVASDLMISMTSVNRKIKKYEDYLTGINQLSAINLSSEATDIEAAMPCFLGRQQATIRTYQFGKFQHLIPALGTIDQDSDNFETLSDEAKKRYFRSFDDLRSEVVQDLLLAHPVCQGVVDEKMGEAAFEKSWDENKLRYEALRKRILPPSFWHYFRGILHF